MSRTSNFSVGSRKGGRGKAVPRGGGRKKGNAPFPQLLEEKERKRGGPASPGKKKPALPSKPTETWKKKKKKNPNSWKKEERKRKGEVAHVFLPFSSTENREKGKGEKGGRGDGMKGGRGGGKKGRRPGPAPFPF